MYGQELNPESYAICKADLLIKGQDIRNIVFGNTLSNDGLQGLCFDYMLSNPPCMAPGGGGVQDKNKSELAEIIEKLNQVFSAGLPEEQVGFVCDVLPSRLRQSTTLRQQAAANGRQQFWSSPDFDQELMDAIIGAFDAHQSMSSQALNSVLVRAAIEDVLLNNINL
jgi:hypothetical protein